MQGNRRSSLVDCPVFRFSARADPRFVSPLAAGVAMSGGFGIVRTGATARSGRRRLDCAGPGWHPLGASASAADVGRGSRSDGPSPRPGREPAVGHALDRAACHRRRARRHRSPAGPDGATGPVHRGLPVRRAGRGASRGRPVRRRGLLRPCWWDAPAGPAAGHATRPGGRRLDPLQGKTPGRGLRRGPRARADTPIEAAGATTGSVDHCFDSEM